MIIGLWGANNPHGVPAQRRLLRPCWTSRWGRVLHESESCALLAEATGPTRTAPPRAHQAHRPPPARVRGELPVEVRRSIAPPRRSRTKPLPRNDRPGTHRLVAKVVARQGCAASPFIRISFCSHPRAACCVSSQAASSLKPPDPPEREPKDPIDALRLFGLLEGMESLFDDAETRSVCSSGLGAQAQQLLSTRSCYCHTWKRYGGTQSTGLLPPRAGLLSAARVAGAYAACPNLDEMPRGLLPPSSVTPLRRRCLTLLLFRSPGDTGLVTADTLAADEQAREGLQAGDPLGASAAAAPGATDKAAGADRGCDGDRRAEQGSQTESSGYDDESFGEGSNCYSEERLEEGSSFTENEGLQQVNARHDSEGRASRRLSGAQRERSTAQSPSKEHGGATPGVAEDHGEPGEAAAPLPRCFTRRSELLPGACAVFMVDAADLGSLQRVRLEAKVSGLPKVHGQSLWVGSGQIRGGPGHRKAEWSQWEVSPG